MLRMMVTRTDGRSVATNNTALSEQFPIANVGSLTGRRLNSASWGKVLGNVTVPANASRQLLEIFAVHRQDSLRNV